MTTFIFELESIMDDIRNEEFVSLSGRTTYCRWNSICEKHVIDCECDHDDQLFGNERLVTRGSQSYSVSCNSDWNERCTTISKAILDKLRQEI
jgi:hypothetical protein